MVVLLFVAVMSQTMERPEKCFVLIKLPSAQALMQCLLNEDRSNKFFEWLAREPKKIQQDNFVDLLQVHFNNCIHGLSFEQKERAKQRSAEIIAFLQDSPMEIKELRTTNLSTKNRRYTL